MTVLIDDIKILAQLVTLCCPSRSAQQGGY